MDQSPFDPGDLLPESSVFACSFPELSNPIAYSRNILPKISRRFGQFRTLIVYRQGGSEGTLLTRLIMILREKKTSAYGQHRSGMKPETANTSEGSPNSG
jgi:hypothetical protein